MPDVVQFSAEVVAAVKRHMNDDHAEDSLLICRGLGGLPDASSASMSGMDAEGIDFDALVNGEPVSVRLPWSSPITERQQIRTEVVLMYRKACEALGVEPRAEEGAG